MQLRLFYILVLLCSCYNPKTAQAPSPVDFDKEVHADDISFFGNVNYDLGRQRQYTLLFKNDQLVRVYLNNKKKGRYYDVKRLNDSVNMIYSDFLATYYTVDTFIFHKNECSHKRVYYSAGDHHREEQTKIDHYRFKEFQCDLSEKDTTYTLWKYPDREQAKLTFFRNFFRS